MIAKTNRIIEITPNKILVVSPNKFVIISFPKAVKLTININIIGITVIAVFFFDFASHALIASYACAANN